MSFPQRASTTTLLSGGKEYNGFVMRILGHGTVVVMDDVSRHSFPYYGNDERDYTLGDRVRFVTDDKDTVIARMEKTGGKEPEIE